MTREAGGVTPGPGGASEPARVRHEPLLFAAAPRVRALPFVPLLEGPTPVAPLPEGVLRGGLFHKRDDRASSLYGGNKVRRYEWVLGDALDRGARTIVTAGGYASTQVTATVLHGRAQGLGVEAVLFEQPMTRFAREALAVDAEGGGVLEDGRGYARTALRLALRMRRADRPYLLVPGASLPLPNLGYVDAMLELALQVEQGLVPRPDRILVPAGSGGTTVGLALGAALLGWDTVVTAVRIAEPLVTNRLTLRALLVATARRLEALGVPGARRLGSARVEVDGRFLGPGYGEPTPAALRGMELVPRLLGVPGEVTYSGKGMAALETWARERPREVILYWHTLSSTGRVASPGGKVEGGSPVEGGRLPDLPPSLRRLASEPLVA